MFFEALFVNEKCGFDEIVAQTKFSVYFSFVNFVRILYGHLGITQILSLEYLFPPKVMKSVHHKSAPFNQQPILSHSSGKEGGVTLCHKHGVFVTL